MAWGGRLRANLARTEPALPWVRVTWKYFLKLKIFLFAAADLPPDDPHGGLGVAPGHAGLVLGLVHVGAPLADVPPATTIR